MQSAMGRLAAGCALGVIVSGAVAGNLPAQAVPGTAPLQNPAQEWSNDDVDRTPAGNLDFHGPFSNENVTVTCLKLDNHDFLQISFDLLILRAWEGNVPVNLQHRPVELGPDFFRLGLADGPTLLYSTFSNIPDSFGNYVAGAKKQNYPSQVPGDHLPQRSAAAAVDTLGYFYPFLGSKNLFPMDATYHIKFIVPHQDYEAILQFSGMNLQNIVTESWGIAHLDVRGVSASQLPRPAVDAIGGAFDAACDVNGNKQIESFQMLINGMDETVKWIEANVSPRPVSAKNASSLIRDFWSDDAGANRRESASPALFHMGPQVEVLLRDARKTAVGEQRLRIDWMLARIGVGQITDPALRRVMLASRVLEIIGSQHAMKVRKDLTQN